jgi:putative Mg2+ transporter-C (MgtC) family protein
MEDLAGLLEMIARPAVAVVGAGILGWEREAHGKPAGLRTQMMVALGASIFTLATLEFYRDIGLAGGTIRIDPLRVVEGVIGGIGFLGAGCIIQARGSVEGITTAATIWVVGAFGVCCGLGYYALGATTVLLAMVVLSGLGFLEKRVLEPRWSLRKAGNREKKPPGDEEDVP